MLRSSERFSTVAARPQALRRTVRFLASVCSRDVTHPADLDTAADYVERGFLAETARVDEERFVARGRRYRNLVASFGPAGSNQPLLVVGAHYDVFASRPGCFPGADDNASGTAGLLELAHLLAIQPPSVPVQLVAYSNEEPPFFGSEDMGSAVHAETLRRSGRSVRGMLCLEMIGYLHGKQLSSSVVLRLLYPTQGDFVVVCGRWKDRQLTRQIKAAMQNETAVRVLSFTGPRSMLESSDQVSYWNRDYSAVMITDSAYLQNPNYHTVHDTAGSLDYDRMAHVVDSIFNALLAIRSV